MSPDLLQEAVDALGLRPDPLDLETLAKVVAPLSGVPCQQWIRFAPVLSRREVDERSRPHPLDLIIHAELKHLQEVCHRPRLDLRVEEERVPVARARRVPVRATASLLSHPEDWEHCTPREIRPQRVLAIQTDDEWEIYENRVAVRLVDHLLGYVSRRLSELRKLERLTRADRYDEDAKGAWRRKQRLYSLWSELFSESKVKQQLDTTLELVEGLYGRLLGLLGSPLYQRVPRSAQVAVHLHPTNILTNDLKYRHVASLWREWLDKAWKPPPTTQERVEQANFNRECFASFARLVALRAGALSCERDGERHVVVGTHDLRIRFRALVARVPHEEHRARQLWDAIANAGEHVLLVGAPEDVWVLPNDLAARFSGWDQPIALCISPWSLDSTERMGRVLATEAARSREPAYPPKIALRSVADVPTHPALRQFPGAAGATTIVCLHPLAPTETRAIVRQLERTRRGMDASRKLPLNEVQGLVENDGLAPRAQCPFCELPGRFEARPGRSPEECTWWCTCSCGASWGLLRCGGCGERFHALSAYDHDAAAGDAVRDVDAMERRFGKDLWAEPCWREDQPAAWRCSKCRKCTGGGCARCRTAGCAATQGRA